MFQSCQPFVLFSHIICVDLKVPQQENSDDAGLFILQYAELLLKNGPETFNLAQCTGFPFVSCVLVFKTCIFETFSFSHYFRAQIIFLFQVSHVYYVALTDLQAPTVRAANVTVHATAHRMVWTFNFHDDADNHQAGFAGHEWF